MADFQRDHALGDLAVFGLFGTSPKPTATAAAVVKPKKTPSSKKPVLKVSKNLYTFEINDSQKFNLFTLYTE